MPASCVVAQRSRQVHLQAPLVVLGALECHMPPLGFPHYVTVKGCAALIRKGSIQLKPHSRDLPLLAQIPSILEIPHTLPNIRVHAIELG